MPFTLNLPSNVGRLGAVFPEDAVGKVVLSKQNVQNQMRETGWLLFS